MLAKSNTQETLDKNIQSLFSVNQEPQKPTDEQKTKSFLKSYPELPPDKWGKWPPIRVSETSQIFLDWLEECQDMVDEEFGDGIWILKVKSIKNYLRVHRENKQKETKVFAFIHKSTGNIHTPATQEHAMETYFTGNIGYNETNFTCMTPYGVKAYYSFVPTHERYLANSTSVIYTDNETDIVMEDIEE
jgi:hypothetical protein